MKMKNVNEKSNLKLNRVNNFDHRVELNPMILILITYFYNSSFIFLLNKTLMN